MKRIWFIAAVIMVTTFALAIRTAHADGVVVIEVVPTPAPSTPTPPVATPQPVLVLQDYDNDAQSVDIAARSAYYSPFDQLYWKFVLWSVEYNRSICPRMVDGMPVYSRSFCEVATDKDEFQFWTNKTPHSTRGKEILRLNVMAADLFFDYIKSAGECGSPPVVPYDGVMLEFVANEDGLYRSANVYNLDGTQLKLMPPDEFNATIGAEYQRRLSGK